MLWLWLPADWCKRARHKPAVLTKPPARLPPQQLSDKCAKRVLKEQEDEARDWQVDPGLRAACEKDVGECREEILPRQGPGCLRLLPSLPSACLSLLHLLAAALTTSLKPLHWPLGTLQCAEELCDDVDGEGGGEVTECLVSGAQASSLCPLSPAAASRSPASLPAGMPLLEQLPSAPSSPPSPPAPPPRSSSTWAA